MIITIVLTWLSHVADEVSQVTYKRKMTHSVQSPDRKEGAEQFVEFPSSVCMYVCMYVYKYVCVCMERMLILYYAIRTMQICFCIDIKPL